MLCIISRTSSNTVTTYGGGTPYVVLYIHMSCPRNHHRRVSQGEAEKLQQVGSDVNDAAEDVALAAYCSSNDAHLPNDVKLDESPDQPMGDERLAA